MRIRLAQHHDSDRFFTVVPLTMTSLISHPCIQYSFGYLALRLIQTYGIVVFSDNFQGGRILNGGGIFELLDGHASGICRE